MLINAGFVLQILSLFSCVYFERNMFYFSEIETIHV